MNKEGILREINNDVVNTSYYPARSDCCDLDGEIFEDVVLDNIKCHRMTFQNCTFQNFAKLTLYKALCHKSRFNSREIGSFNENISSF